MKKFIKDWLVNFALIVLCIDIISFLINKNWDIVAFNLELVFVTLLIRLQQMLTNKLVLNYPLLEYLLEYVMVNLIVFGFGWLFDWYNVSGMWFVFIVIAAVYIIAYALDLTKTKKDVAYINEQIKKIRTKKIEQDGNTNYAAQEEIRRDR